jgi:hypothetical protein
MNPADADLTRREERLVRNETLFRQVNERLKELGESFTVVADKADFICECSSERCTDQISLALADYQRVRSEPTQFVVVSGHELPEIERVAYELDGGLLVVVKTEGELAAVTAEGQS